MHRTRFLLTVVLMCQAGLLAQIQQLDPSHINRCHGSPAGGFARPRGTRDHRGTHTAPGERQAVFRNG